MNDYSTLSEASELVGKSKETLRRWDNECKLSVVLPLKTLHTHYFVLESSKYY
jgi:hypothetical protein